MFHGSTIYAGPEGSASRQAILRIEQLQDEAFDLLVHEKLAADESFRIFVTLSNDVLGQLKTNHLLTRD